MKLYRTLKCVTDFIPESLEIFKRKATLYFHWPYCQNICSYCNFNKYKQPKTLDSIAESRFKDCLIKELEVLLSLSSVKTIESVYFGGGTPSLASPETIASILKRVKQNASTESSVEVTIECNPSSPNTLNHLRDYKAAGINRVSIGLQTVNNNTLQLLGRDHTAEKGLAILGKAIEIFGNQSVSVDILFGKPNETLESWTQELTEVLSYNPSHISLYQLTPERGTLLYDQLQKRKLSLPNNDLQATQYEVAVGILKEAMFSRYEVANFAKDGAESQHNLNYWHGTQYIGIGPGAHGRFYSKESNSREARVQILDPSLWQKGVEQNGHGTRVRQKQNKLDILYELIATSLRTASGILQSRWNLFEPSWSVADVFSSSPSIRRLVRDDFLKWNSEGNLCATDKGFPLIDAILPTMINVLSEKYNNNENFNTSRDANV